MQSISHPFTTTDGRDLDFWFEMRYRVDKPTRRKDMTVAEHALCRGPPLSQKKRCIFMDQELNFGPMENA